MNSANKFQALEHEESNAVISFRNETTFKVSKFMETINRFFQQLILSKLSEQLRQTDLGSPINPRHSWNNSSGMKVEILEPQSGEWKKGKVRMRVILEFCPNEPEEIEDSDLHKKVNSLDDIRQTMT